MVPRSVVFRHKGSDLPPRALGAALGARLLLSGRVMQRGAYGRAGRHAEAGTILHRLESSTDRHVDPYQLALVRVALGDHAGALADLRRAAGGRFLWLAFFGRCDPRIDPVRGVLDAEGRPTPARS